MPDTKVQPENRKRHTYVLLVLTQYINIHFNHIKEKRVVPLDDQVRRLLNMEQKQSHRLLYGAFLKSFNQAPQAFEKWLILYQSCLGLYKDKVQMKKYIQYFKDRLMLDEEGKRRYKVPIFTINDCCFFTPSFRRIPKYYDEALLYKALLYIHVLIYVYQKNHRILFPNKKYMEERTKQFRKVISSMSSDPMRYNLDQIKDLLSKVPDAFQGWKILDGVRMISKIGRNHVCALQSYLAYHLKLDHDGKWVGEAEISFASTPTQASSLMGASSSAVSESIRMPPESMKENREDGDTLKNDARSSQPPKKRMKMHHKVYLIR